MAVLGDADGDGWHDIAVGSPTTDEGCVYVVSGLDAECIRTITPSVRCANFGDCLLSVPDLDDDGFADLVVGAPARGNLTVKSMILAFSERSPEPLFVVSGEDDERSLGHELALLDDLDGDGLRDIMAVTQKPRAQGSSTEAIRATVLSSSRGARLHSVEGERGLSWARNRICGIPDQTGDGVADYCVVLRRDGVDQLSLHSGKDGTRVRWITPPDSRVLTGPLCSGDCDGDGLADLLVGAELGQGDSRRHVVVAFHGPALEPFREYPFPTGTELVGAFCVAPDLDGDDVPEVVVGVPSAWGQTEAHGHVNGGAVVVNGATGKIASWLTPDDDSSAAPGETVLLADINADGSLDVVMGRHSYLSGGLGICAYDLASGRRMLEFRQR